MKKIKIPPGAEITWSVGKAMKNGDLIEFGGELYRVGKRLTVKRSRKPAKVRQ